MRQLLGALLVAAVLTGCGGGGDDARDDVAATGSSTTTTTTTDEDEVEAADGTSTTTAAPGAPTTTVAAPAPDGSPVPAEGDPFVPAGTYRYRQAGTTTAGPQSFDTPPEGTLVVDAPDGARQVLHRFIDPDGEAADVVVEVADGVARLVETVVRQGGQEVRCTFDPPVASPRAVGDTATGHGECGDLLDVDIEVRATGTTTVALDGRSFDALVTETITRTSGQVVSETRSLDHVLVELGIPAHTEMRSTGSFGTFTFESEGTSDLLSTVPA